MIGKLLIGNTTCLQNIIINTKVLYLHLYGVPGSGYSYKPIFQMFSSC